MYLMMLLMVVFVVVLVVDVLVCVVELYDIIVVYVESNVNDVEGDSDGKYVGVCSYNYCYYFNLSLLVSIFVVFGVLLLVCWMNVGDVVIYVVV